MAKIVMYWDCEYSSNKKIPGYIRVCPGCNHPRSKDVVFYHSKPPHVASAEEIVLMGKPDPNWYCGSCRCGNLQKDKKCWQCGDSRKADSAVQPVRTPYKADGLVFSTEQAKEMEKRSTHVTPKAYVPEVDPYDPQSSNETVATPKKVASESWPVASSHSTPISESESKLFNEETLPVIKKAGISIGTLIIAIIICVMSYNFFFKTHVETVQVTAMPWTQSVRIEEYLTFQEQGWEIPAEVPGFSSAGRQTGVESRKSGDLKVHDGWTTEEVDDTCHKDVEVADTCTRYTMQPDTCTGSRSVSATCTGSEYVSETCYQDDGNGGSESYECGGYESYTYSCTESESYEYSCETSQPESYACTKTESQPYACKKTVDVELYHYEDVMSPWYWYDLERWTTIQTYPTSGNGPDVFYDPIQPTSTLQRRIEEGGQYFVTFGPVDNASKIQPWTNEYDLNGFKYFFLMQPHEVDVNRQGDVFELR